MLGRVMAAMALVAGAACTGTGAPPSSTAGPPSLADRPGFFRIPGDGIDMQARLFLPAANAPSSAAVLLPGGRGPAEVGRLFTHHLVYASELGARGIAVLALDHHSDQRTLHDRRTVADIGRAIDWLKARPTIRPDRIVLVGFSMGGANALRVAGSRPDVAGLVTYFAPVDARPPGDDGPVSFGEQPIDYAAGVRCPTLIFQGDADEITPVEQARRLFTVLLAQGKRAELVVYPGAKHGFTYLRAPRGPCCNYDAGFARQSIAAVADFIAGLDRR